MIRASLEGSEAVQKAFDRFPDAMIREMRKSIRRHLRPVTDKIKASSPKQEWSSFAASKVSNRSGLVSGVVGFFGDKAQGMEWYKAYWLNYGTLAGRDPAHQFKNRLKSSSKPKQKHGIDYEHFFERAVAGQDIVVMSQVERDLEEFCNKLHND